MKANDSNITEFKVKFNADNAFICGTSDTMKVVAEKQLELLEAQGNTVIVTDPYLFPKGADSAFESDLTDILKSLHAKNIVLCVGQVLNMPLFQSIQAALKAEGCQLTHNSALNDCHDRFWICMEKDKAVVFGTSLNGLCKRICRIDELKADEVAELKKELKARGIE